MNKYEVGLTKTITEYHYVTVEARDEEVASKLARDYLDDTKDLEPDSRHVQEVWIHEVHLYKD